MLRQLTVQLAAWRHTVWLRAASIFPFQGPGPQLAAQGNVVRHTSDSHSVDPVDSLSDILGPLWFAVPKSKVSWSNKM
jgi:hypothetical protein